MSGTEAEILPDTRHLSIRNLRLRLFDGSDTEDPCVLMETPLAELDRAENRAEGGGFVHLVGRIFTATGNRWTFFGDGGTLLLEDGVQLFFESDSGGELASSGGPWPFPVDCGDGFATATGDALEVSGGPQVIFLRLFGSVSVRAPGFSLSCARLEAEIRCGQPLALLAKTLDGDSLRRVRADGGLCLEDGERLIHADGADIFPVEGVLLLSGAVCIEDAGTTLCGERIVLRRGDASIYIEDGGSSRQMVSLDFD
jgi:hypothetical protein